MRRRPAPRSSAIVAASLVTGLGAPAACSLTDTTGLSDGSTSVDASLEGSASDAGRGSEGAADGGAPDATDTPASRYRAEVLADAPVAYWRLEERSGTRCKDESGHGNDAELIGNYSLGAAGAIPGGDDSAVSLGAGTGRIRVGKKFDFAGVVPFSFEAWVKPKGQGSILSKLLLSAGGTPSIGTTFYVTSTGSFHTGFERWDGNTNRNWIQSSYLPSSDRFTHYVVTFSGSLTTLYVNGSIDDSHQDNANIPTNDVDFEWGGFDGTLDELAVYDSLLSPDRVAAHYAAATARP